VIRRSVCRLVGIVKGDGEWSESLRSGEVTLPVSTAALAVTLTAVYGLVMGAFGVAHGVATWREQLLANVVKVPALALASFALSVPAFFAANALGGLRLPARDALRLWAATFAVFAAVLGALVPAAGVVSVVCNYSFATLINLVFFAVAGLTSVDFLLRSVGTLHRSRAVPAVAKPARLLVAFGCWALVLAVFGVQIGWRMRPLIGWHDAPFGWFRTDGMSLWDGVASEIHNILTDGGV
jgi:hypothetical protein